MLFITEGASHQKQSVVHVRRNWQAFHGSCLIKWLTCPKRQNGPNAPTAGCCAQHARENSCRRKYEVRHNESI